MGFLARLKTGWALSMDSLDVLRAEPSLAVFPAVAGLAGTVYLVLVLGGAVLLTGADPGPVVYVALFVVYLGTAFVAAFFSAALTYNAREVFRGRDPTLSEGLAAAWRNRGTLFVWAVVSAVVGVVLRAIESQDSPVAEIVATAFGVAWGILTYFVVPVIVFEDVSVSEMFRRSGGTFKRTGARRRGPASASVSSPPCSRWSASPSPPSSSWGSAAPVSGPSSPSPSASWSSSRPTCS